MNVPAYGVRVCRLLRPQLKASAFQTLMECLRQIPAGAPNCAPARGQACIDQIFSRTTCDVPVGDAGADATAGCAAVAASCGTSDGGPGITAGECTRWVHPYRADVRAEVFDCYNDPDNASIPCAERFVSWCAYPDTP